MPENDTTREWSRSIEIFEDLGQGRDVQLTTYERSFREGRLIFLIVDERSRSTNETKRSSTATWVPAPRSLTARAKAALVALGSGGA